MSLGREAALVVVNPSGARTRVSIRPVPFLVGRQPGNHLVIRDNRVSRNHCRIIVERGDHVLEDTASTHGVFVNGQRVARHILRDKDRIEFGVPDGYQLVFAAEEGDLNRLLDQFDRAAPAGGGNLAKLRAVVEIARMLQSSLSVDEVLAALDLTALERHEATETSLGEQQRTAIARALANDPNLLVLDEPSTGIDPAARREFLGYLGELRERQGVTIVLTTHHMEEAERCDRIGVLHQGRLAAIAPPAELRARVGGDVVAIRAREPGELQKKIAARMQVAAVMVDGMLRVERPRGHEFVRDVVAAFGDEIETVTFGKPTLEDVFVHLTGQRFYAGPAGDEQ
jgi:energy-coupling factor transporter ATP-binding protein EcfA2